ncbi:MAG: hypothetical protein ACI808_001799 [Paraglaciecola sp.]|jgi:hypothetical protein
MHRPSPTSNLCRGIILQYFRIITYILLIFTLFISFTFVPYIESEYIKDFTYLFIIPVELGVFIFLINSFRKRKLDGLILLIYFLFMIFFTWLSLNIMSWPTYWFAGNNETLYIQGVGVQSTKVGTRTYKMYFSRIDEDILHNIPIRSNLYDMFHERCQFKGFPVVSISWWAGNVILEKNIVQAISEYCIKQTQQ